MMNELKVPPYIRVVPSLCEGNTLRIKNLKRNDEFSPSGGIVFEVLREARDWIAEPELRTRLQTETDLEADSCGKLVAVLLEYGILVEREASEQSAQPREKWRDVGWEAAWQYHRTIRDFPSVDWSDADAWRENHGDGDAPSSYKRYDGTETIDLPEPSEKLSEIGLSTAMNFRHRSAETDVDFGVQSLATLLFFVFGELDHFEDPDVGRLSLKTSPSGGARHPTEAYVVPHRIDELEERVYHYSVEQHALEVVPDAHIEPIVDHVESGDSSAPIVSVGLSSVVARNMTKYRDPRVFRILQQDIGHLLETLRLVTTVYELHVDHYPELSPAVLSDAFCLDTFDEPVYGLVGVS